MSFFSRTIATTWVIVALAAGQHVLAGEVHSNGLGGGDWSDKGSWKDDKVPGPDDEVIISRGDRILFDRDDTGKVTCKQLLIDPRGLLEFKPATEKAVLCVTEGIESYGGIKMHARTISERFELRLVGEDPAKRFIKLLKNSSLLLYGKAGKHNVLLAGKPDGEKGNNNAEVTTDGPVMVDLQNAQLVDVFVKVKNLDNTGAKVNEKINILGCKCTGHTAFMLNGCDTPIFANNTMDYDGPAVIHAGIYVASSPLAEIKGNRIKGKYQFGIQGSAQTDSIVFDNYVEAVNTQGVYWYGVNAMIKGLTVKDCTIGLTLTSATGAIEDVTLIGCKTGYYHAAATVQATNLRFKDVPKGGIPVSATTGPLTLLNCEATPEMITVSGKPLFKAVPKAKGGKRIIVKEALIESWNYLIVKASGNVPKGSQVEVTTLNPDAELKPGAADPNVRNPLGSVGPDGLTPLPRTLEATVVKSWIVDKEGMRADPFEYQVRVLAPPTAPDAPRRVLAEMTVTADDSWFRSNPNDALPTVEVRVP